MSSRDETRRFLTAAWRKATAAEPMAPLESLIAGIVREHPEFHALLADDAQAASADFAPGPAEVNPFLHLGLHIALAEQLEADRPHGVRAEYARLARGHSPDRHAVEHRMMTCLAEALEHAQRRRALPDEQRYLAALRRL